MTVTGTCLPRIGKPMVSSSHVSAWVSQRKRQALTGDQPKGAKGGAQGRFRGRYNLFGVFLEPKGDPSPGKRMGGTVKKTESVGMPGPPRKFLHTVEVENSREHRGCNVGNERLVRRTPRRKDETAVM